MTPVRGKRGRLIHLSADLRKTLCGRRVEGWIVEPDTNATCSVCVDVDLDIARNGN